LRRFSGPRTGLILDSSLWALWCWWFLRRVDFAHLATDYCGAPLEQPGGWWYTCRTWRENPPRCVHSRNARSPSLGTTKVNGGGQFQCFTAAKRPVKFNKLVPQKVRRAIRHSADSSISPHCVVASSGDRAYRSRVSIAGRGASCVFSTVSCLHQNIPDRRAVAHGIGIPIRWLHPVSGIRAVCAMYSASQGFTAPKGSRPGPRRGRVMGRWHRIAPIHLRSVRPRGGCQQACRLWAGAARSAILLAGRKFWSGQKHRSWESGMPSLFSNSSDARKR